MFDKVALRREYSFFVKRNKEGREKKGKEKYHYSLFIHHYENLPSMSY